MTEPARAGVEQALVERETATPAASRVRALCFLLLSVLLVGSIFAVPYLPTNDGPEWVYLAHVENHFDDPHTTYADEYSRTSQFASRGFSAIYRPLERWLGWQRGLQVALGAVVLFAAWAFVALVNAIDRRRWALGFLGFPLALSWHFYMGFWSFVVGGSVGMLGLAFCLRRKSLDARGYAGLAVLLLVEAVAHVFSAVLTGGVVLWLLVRRAPRGRRLREGAFVLLAGLPASLVLVATVLTARGQATRMLARTAFQYLPWRTTLALFPQTLVPGPLWRALLVTGTLVALAGGAVVRIWRSRGEESLSVAALLLLACALLAPVEVPGWSFFAQRFAPLGLALVIGALPFERLPPERRKNAVGGLFAVAVAWLLVSLPFHRALAGTVHDAWAGLDANVHRSRRVLPVPLADAEGAQGIAISHEVPELSPLLHMGALYAVTLGGTIPSVFTANPAIHPLLRREHPGEPGWYSTPERYWGAVASTRFARDDDYRHAIEGALASVGMFYEGVVLLGARPDDGALWQSRGYVVDAQMGSAVVAHFRPCRVDVVMRDAPQGIAGTFDVLIDNFQLVSNAHPIPRTDSEGLTHFEVARAPCGDLLVRAQLRSPTGPVACKNGDAEGRLRGEVTRTVGTIVCE